MPTIGTPFTDTAKKVMLCGSGELGKEVVIELQRYGVEVIACDAYQDAPAMQVADRSYVFSMLDGAELRRVIELEKPDLVVPEVEAIATEVLAEVEQQGRTTIIPTARATQLTMNREGIRRMAAEDLGCKTSPYRFAETEEEYLAAVEAIGLPCVVKPIMSSSGKGQSTLKSESDIKPAWDYAQAGGRAGAGKVIVEGFVDFDYEITLLTVRHAGGTSFCAPVGHIQVDGDYRESWQPTAMSEAALASAQKMASDKNGFGRDRKSWRLRRLRDGNVCQRRRGHFQRSLPSSTRHRNGYHDFSGPKPVRPSRASHPRSSHSQHRPTRPKCFLRPRRRGIL